VRTASNVRALTASGLRASVALPMSIPPSTRSSQVPDSGGNS
jgi:hypothetical protein